VDVGGPPGEDQEGGLERVLGQVNVTRHPPTEAEHHRPEPVDQLGERALLPRLDEPGEQLAIGQF
jgi:hypothetical protein